MDADAPKNSVFHQGERELQSRAGVRDKMERIGRQLIHDQLTEEHCRFYEQLPCVLVGHVDGRGRPWASVLTGSPGFIRCLDAHTLRIEARPAAGDPLQAGLVPDNSIALLGIDLQTRRRNRVSGRISAVASDRIALSVLQAFGNCPRYIQRRELLEGGWESADVPEVRGVEQLEGRARDMIAGADTFFVASHSGRAGDAVSRGADVSHRGGRPGFIRIDDTRTLTVPDYAGNRFFNTLGNFLVDPRAGLLFVDFTTGDILMLTGTVEILEDPALVAQVSGAERMWRFRLWKGQLLRHALALRWRLGEYSPHSLQTGVWDRATPLPEE